MFVLRPTHSVLGLFAPLLFNSLFPDIISLWSTLEKESYSLEVVNSKEIEKDTFDFIVVGGGSAGSVLVNRLSEHFSVLLLERGGEPNPITAIPSLSVVLTSNPDVDYAYKTLPQTGACLGNYNKSCSWSRGKGLGGSSNINWQIYFRGHPSDYDAWANLTGDERWSYKSVLPFFLKSEDYCVSCEKYKDDPTFNPLFHNTNGFLTIGKSTSQPLVEEFLQASEWDGIKRTDLNAPYTKGCAPIVYTQRRGRRCSTKIAFIDPVRHRPNLTIRKYARAYKVLFRKLSNSNEAYGVEYEHVGFPKVAYATKEIIIATGAIETPKLLMLSGIGPRDHLQSFDIPLVMDLPVGKNVQDHMGVFLGPFMIKEGKSLLLERDVTFANLLEFVENGTGHFTQPGLQAVSYLTSSVAKNNGEEFWPDIQVLFGGMGVSPVLVSGVSAINVRKDLTNPFFESVLGRDAFTTFIFNQRPKSRGEITLASKNYKDDPLIDPKYYQDAKQTDIKIVIEGIKRAVYMFENAPSFKSLNAQYSSVPFPACNNTVFRSDEYWECLTRYLSASSFHYSGSASMGKEGSSDAVVDPELRVIGVKRLRVIDASIMPIVPSVNINGPTIMIGERGAQLILDTYLK